MGRFRRRVAFEGLLSDGEAVRRSADQRLFRRARRPQLVHIATDGESYGHHHHFGEMALAYALDHIENEQAREADQLRRVPGNVSAESRQVEIVDNSSWSCVHGVERWRSDCGCNSGGHADWNQEWRAPLRAALDWLRDTLAPHLRRATRRPLADPWEARDEYIE